MNPAIFRPNDIRGIVDQDLTSEDFILIGQGYAKFLLDRGVNQTVIGRDNRIHSAALQSALTQGLLSSGIDVIDLGEVTTPMVYFARYHLKIPGGVSVTASHNPPEWNGAKLCFGGGAIHEEEIYEIQNNVRLQRFAAGEGKLTSFDIIPAYLTNIRERSDFNFIKSNLKIKTIGVDSGNGLAGRFIPPLLKELGLKVTELFSESDGTYPNHLPDPSLGQNMKDLWHLRDDNELDLGLAYDGDVDRLNVIDSEGVILWGDGLTTFFARDVLHRSPGLEILYDVMSSPGVPEDISRHNGAAIMVPTGHAIVAHRLHRLQAPMAGEYSGHHYFIEGYLGFDDAIYSTFRMLNILAKEKITLSSYMSDLPFWLSSGVTNIPVSEGKKTLVTAKLQESLEDKYFVDKTSGLRVKIDSCWATVHPSSTESMLRLVVWGKEKSEVEQTRKLLMGKINPLL